ncbi:cysteine-rich CWC family protein [Thalassolituus marinus]|uniref:Cysteine-rich CWC family protein n=1 Tax=Thalassolituus marinus TaxID=671053 RepID=A0ABS7ZMC2_9GAMM|nr:cysteine-rich CWC family protein [Thalassolituus marinus]
MENISAVKPDDAICPLCGEENRCGLKQASVEQTCWCFSADVSIPQALLDKVPVDQRHKACICLSCITEFKSSQSRAL